MEASDIILIWVSVIFLAASTLVWLSTRPSKCPKCGGRMQWRCRAKFGREVCSIECPHCGYEEILNIL